MKPFNLSEWALAHRSLVTYLMLMLSIAGLVSYEKLGREEDPAFTIKTMLIQAQWPGASAEETAKQITDRIEKKLEELDVLDYTRSMTTPGETTVFVNLRDDTKASDVAPTWVRVRNMISDIRAEFPSGIVGPFFNDRFSDVYGNIYAFTSDGVSPRQLRDYVEMARSRVLTVPNVGKVDIFGAQDEVIYLEFSPRKLSAFGISQQSVVTALQEQNSIVPSGVIEAGTERISIRVSGQFTSERDLTSVNFRINNQFFRLSDIAEIKRGVVDPPVSLFHFNGRPAIGLAIGMRPKANLLKFGEALNAEMDRITTDLPAGVDVHLVSDQPKIVEEAVFGFTRALFEAVAIVLLVSFLSLGARAGLVVALSIPLVLAITFAFMDYDGITLQRISLGALIIALGLLVDDAMIAVEMMVARLEAGDPLNEAASYVYTSTAFPMLTGTLVTVAGFIPIAFNGSAAGEFTYTLFVVLAVSLLVSWIVAVLFTPLIGVWILPDKIKGHHDKPGRLFSAFSSLLQRSMRHRWVTIGLTLLMFAASIVGMGFVQQQFFPSSDRVELVVDWYLPHNVSIEETKAQMMRFEKEAIAGNADVERWSTYIGQGAPRFVLSFDVQIPHHSFGQMIIVSKSLEARDRLRKQLDAFAKREFVGTDVNVKLLDIGPPVGRPVQYRLSGPDVATLRAQAQKLASVVASDPRIGDVVYDWNEPARVLKVNVLQDKARLLGVTSENIASTLNSIVGGTSITQIRDDIYLVNMTGRALSAERGSLEALQNLQLSGSNGQPVPLAAVATFGYGLEQPIIWRRNRQQTITIKAGIVDATQPATVVAALSPAIEKFQAALPSGYDLALGGSVEESEKGQGPIIAVIPMMLITMATILMVQLQSFQRLFLVVAVAPLGLIGVVAALLPSGAPMGFVATLGVLALIGILIRNSVILVVQIEHLRTEGKAAWDAVVEATEHRMRPIMLTAAAASLALIPISREVFWGPMAYAMMGGIIVGTVLTLLFLPALYIAWFRIEPPEDGAANRSSELALASEAATAMADQGA